MPNVQHARAEIILTDDEAADVARTEDQAAALVDDLLHDLPPLAIVQPLKVLPTTKTMRCVVLQNGVRLTRVSKNGKVAIAADVAYEVPDAG